MSSQFVHQCLTVLSNVISGLSLDCNKPQLERICTHVATAFTEDRATSIQSPLSVDQHIAYLVPALLQRGHRERESVIVVTKNQAEAKSRMALLESILSVDWHVGASVTIPEHIATLLSPSLDHDLCHFLETGEYLTLSWKRNRLEKARANRSKRKFEEELERATKASIIFMSQALYVNLIQRNNLRDLPHNAVIIDAPSDFSLLLRSMLAYSHPQIEASTKLKPSDTSQIDASRAELGSYLSSAILTTRRCWLPLVGEESYADIDPMSTWSLKYEPELTDWLSSALAHHRQIVIHAIIGELGDSKDRQAQLHAVVAATRSELRQSRGLIQRHSRTLDQSLEGSEFQAAWFEGREKDRAEMGRQIKDYRDLLRRLSVRLRNAFGQEAYVALDPLLEEHPLVSDHRYSWAQTCLRHLDEYAHRTVLETERVTSIRGGVPLFEESETLLKSTRLVRQAIASDLKSVPNETDRSYEENSLPSPVVTLEEIGRLVAHKVEFTSAFPSQYQLDGTWYKNLIDSQIHELSELELLLASQAIEPWSHDSRRELVKVAGTGIRWLRLIDATYAEVSPISVGAISTPYEATVGGTDSEPSLEAYSSILNRAPDYGFRLRSYWRVDAQWRLDGVANRGGRPIVVAPDTTSKLAIQFGVFNRDMPYVVD